MNNTRLLKKTGIYFIGNLSSKILTALLLPLYAFYISTSDFGYFDYSQTIMNVVMPFAFLAIWESILRFLIAEKNENIRNKIIGTSSIFCIFAGIITSVLIYVYGMIVPNKINYLGLIIAMIISHSLAQIWQYYARALEHNKIFVISGIGATIINFVFIILLVCKFNLGIVGLYVAYILGQFSIVLIIEWNIKILKKIRFKNFDFIILKKMLLFSMPLVFNLVSVWIMSGFGRIIITNYFGVNQNGLYTFANKFSQLVTILGNVIIMAMIEEAILATNDEHFAKKFSKTMQKLFYLFQTLIIIAIPVIAIFYKFIGKTEYSNSLQYIPYLLIYSVLMTMSSNVGSVFQVIDKTKYQFITTLTGGIVTVIFSFSTIKVLGVYSVVFGQVLGAMAMLLSRYLLAIKYVDIKIKWIEVISMFLVFVIVSQISIRASILINVSIIILLLIGIFILNKDNILMILSKIKGKFKTVKQS